MQLQVNLPIVSIEQYIEHIFTTRQITRFNQELLMSALLSKKALSGSEQVSINRVFDGLRSGLIKVAE